MGTRPEWIHLRAYLDSEKLARGDFILVNTGQHKDFQMAKAFFEELGLPSPNFDMNSSPVNLPLVLARLPQIFSSHNVSDVTVIGDTDSALSGAIAAHLSKVHLTHVEAGLRCNEPIPEEYNRRCIDALADTLLAPQSYAVSNLRRERVVGEVLRSPNYKVIIFRRLASEIMKEQIGHDQASDVLTLHRQENVDNKNGLKSILEYLALTHRSIKWPVHPRTLDRIRYFGLEVPSNIELLKPMPYKSMIRMMISARRIFTDSGGVTLEAFELKKELVIFRNAIEWSHVLKSPRTTLIQVNTENQ